MPEGTCKLCLKTRILQDSHFMPKSSFKRLRDPKSQNPNPIVVTPKKTTKTSKQMKDYLLCAECEDRFNSGGESWMLKMIGHGKRFPLRDRLSVAIPEFKGDEAVQYSGLKTGIETDKLGYFALSVLWRGAVHEWKGPLGDKSSRLDLGAAEEPIRGYLLGETGFPSDVAVIVNICTDRTTREILLQPFPSDGQYGRAFEMVFLGVHFFIVVGPGMNPVVRDMCCVTSKVNRLFVRDCFDRSQAHYLSLAPTSKRSRDIEQEWPD